MIRRWPEQRQHAAHERQPLTGLWVTCQGDDRLRGALLGGEAGRLAERVTVTITSIP